MNRRKTIHSREKAVTYVMKLSPPTPKGQAPKRSMGKHRCQGLKNVIYGPRRVGLVTLLGGWHQMES